MEITQSSGLTLLDKSALKAVSGWQFKPYEKNGIRIASRVRIPVVFSLN
ncbi:energy transducer TonB [Amphritea opalescens]